MPLYDTQEQNFAYNDIRCLGPVAQAYPFSVASLAPPATLAAGATWSSSVLPSDGFKAMAAGVKLSQAGSLVIARFIDLAGQVPLDTQTTALTAGQSGFKTMTDGLPFGSFMISVTNSGGSAATLSNFAVLMNAT
jgi:hypothetical protein